MAIKLRKVSELAVKARGGTITEYQVPEGQPIIQGEGYMDYSCPACGLVLIKSVQFNQVWNFVFRCRCGELSETPAIPNE